MPSLTTTPDLPGEVEQELEQRGHRFERYADDCDVHVRSQKLGERALAGLCKIDDRQHPRVNEAKSAVRAPMIAILRLQPVGRRTLNRSVAAVSKHLTPHDIHQAM